MKIAIRANEYQKNELNQKGFNGVATIHWIEENKNSNEIAADAVFDFLFDGNNIITIKVNADIPVFVNAVNKTCRDIGKPNYIRLNGWNGFINRETIELACNDSPTQQKAGLILDKLSWKFAWVKDDYGFVTARIIAMIINEAYYALEENVSTKDEIDIAMKLGTNYPYGPFEWSRKIGLQNILGLLNKLAKENKRYTISTLLVHESQLL